MPKKKLDTSSASDLFFQDIINSNDINDINNSNDINDIKDSNDSKDKKKLYSFSLKMPIEFKEFLKQVSFEESTPEHRVSMNEYICQLIEKDMNKRKDK